MLDRSSNRLVAAFFGGSVGLLWGVSCQAADLVVGAFGGVWETSFRECVVAPFEKRTGKKVDIVLGTPIQWLNQIAASPSKPPLDVVLMPTETAYDGSARGLIDKLPTEKMPNASQQAQQFKDLANGFGYVHNYGAMGLIYNSDTVKNPPKTWKDFVEGTVAGKWKASLPTINYPSAGFTFSSLFLAEQYGGNIDNVTPGYAQIKRMLASGNLSLWLDPNQILNGLKSGDIDIAAYWDGRAWAFIDDAGNQNFKYYTPAPGAIVAMTWIQKVKGGSGLADDFINSALAKEPQSCFGSRIRYGTPNVAAAYDPKVTNEITNISELIFPPFKDIPSRQAKWLEQWNKEVGR
jgi:putative spermidine/putrescine transport system substrate-binding protein